MGGRAVECTGLENRSRVSLPWVRIPPHPLFLFGQPRSLGQRKSRRRCFRLAWDCAYRLLSVLVALGLNPWVQPCPNGEAVGWFSFSVAPAGLKVISQGNALGLA